MKKGKLFVRLGTIIAVIVVILNALQILVISYFTKQDLLEQDTVEYVEMARLYAREIGSEMDQSKRSLDFYVEADVCQTEDPDEIVTWLQEHANMRRSDFDYVSYVDSNGNFASDIGTYTNVADRDYFKAIMYEGADEYIDNPVVSKTTGKMVVHIARAVKIAGRTIGFFCGNSSPQKITEIIEHIKIGKDGSATLISGTNSMVATSGNEEEIVKILESKGMQEFLVNKEAYMDEDGMGSSVVKTSFGKYYLFFAPVSGTDWLNIIIMSESQMLESSTKISLMLCVASILIGVIIIVSLCVRISMELKPLETLESSINEIAHGRADLTQRIELKYRNNNEIGRIIYSFNHFMRKIQRIITSVKTVKDDLITNESQLSDSTEETAGSINAIIENIDEMVNYINTNSSVVEETTDSVNVIASSIDLLANMIESQSSSVTEASVAVEEMIGNINSVNSSVGKMAASFQELEEKSAEGVQKQEDVNSKIIGISSESEALQEANAVISSIAEQTNLLAMNAAIEAAHAGEAGRGFSVVADEIRKLSETSSEQSKTIGQQLKKINEGINEIVNASRSAAETFASVTTGMNDTNSLVSQIKNAMDEQAEGSRQISMALTNMNEGTAKVKDASKAMEKNSKMIIQDVHTLQESTASMKSGIDEIANGATKIKETGSVLQDISITMSKGISKIKGEVDLFKV